ncbi:hypothetical protein [Nocardia stercoris]|uniref:Secreted protein n=1 Tax=Nocardia stercoris TaxID=2483361 RepID=A0A3M2KZZ0_9NOCA|nr:hypothetical protein [Nocardia stercoris]RMI30992.1 hypothetical protein EBN03_20435 [Nocardia stercoris]
MNKQVKGFAVLMGAAAVSIATAGTASADDIAPGVSCDGLTCANDTDVAYVVTGVADCVTGLLPLPHIVGWPDLPPTIQGFPFSQVAQPHSTVTLTPACTDLPLQAWRITGAEPSEQ